MLDNLAKEFFRRVLPWPQEDQGRYVGWCNVHWTFKVAGKKEPLWTGKPFQTHEKFCGFIDWLSAQKDPHDIYFCTSLQAKTYQDSKTGKVRAAKHANDALALKAIWLDVDVKTPGKHKDKLEYETLKDALAAVRAFLQQFNLPPPSAVVGSGGGAQVYWINKTPLSPSEWQRYSQSLRAAADKAGLYCDGGCTIDSARVLRVPGTFNWKTGSPRPTKVLGVGKEVDFAELGALLPAITAAVTPPQSAGGIKMDPAFDTGEPIESLSIGCEHELPPLDIKPILSGCAFLREALLTGGKAYANPLWHLTTLCATFLPDGEKFAHGFAKGHATYSKAETDALFARKIRDRDERGIGWPGCAAIHANGSQRCAKCPHFGRGKSPLNLGVQSSAPSTSSTGQTATTAGTGAAGSGKANQLELPPGYAVDEHGYICVLKEVKADKSEEKDGPPETIYIRIFQNKFSNAWVGRTPELTVNFTTTLDLGRTGPVAVSQSSMATVHDLLATLYGQGVLPEPTGEQYVKGFFMSWLGKLQDAKAAIESRPFGWIYGDKGREGFSFGGWSFRNNGTKTTSGFVTSRMRENYTPRGSAATWIDATRMITDRKRADLNCLMVSGFAAPLVAIPAQKAVLLSVYGLTGKGKTTAVQLALSIWGHPLKEKLVKDSSPKSVIARLGELNNLPSYWDEMSVDKQKSVYEVLTTASEGVEGTKLKSDRSFAKQGDWQTMLVITSNGSFNDHVVLKSKDTSAGLYRVFEYKILEPKERTGLISDTDATRIMQNLEQNYGQIGLQYAEMLGRDPAAVDAFVMKCVNDIRAAVQPREEERYWTAGAGALLAAGHYAKHFGVDIDIDELRKFIIEVYLLNRARVAREGLEGGTVASTEDILASFLKAYIGETLWTDIFSKGRGKPILVNWLDGPPRGTNYRKTPINVHYAVEEREVHFSRKVFFNFLAKDNGMSSYIVSGLADHFKATYDRLTLGAGTIASGSNEFVVKIKIPPGSALEESMYAYRNRAIDTGGMHMPSQEDTVIQPGIIPSKEVSIIEQAMKQAKADLDRARKL